MDSFQTSILWSAVTVLILTLVFIGMSLTNSKSNVQWPPVVPQCPDYWRVEGEGKNVKCINEQDLGTCPKQNGQDHYVADFNTPEFTGIDSRCKKYTWAKNCGVAWDGITYGVENPCNKVRNQNDKDWALNNKNMFSLSRYFFPILFALIGGIVIYFYVMKQPTKA